MIGQSMMKFLNNYEKLWGIHTVDRFATHYNKKCVIFNSKYWCPDTECIDAFNTSWTEENNWLVPRTSSPKFNSKS